MFVIFSSAFTESCGRCRSLLPGFKWRNRLTLNSQLLRSLRSKDLEVLEWRSRLDLLFIGVNKLIISSFRSDEIILAVIAKSSDTSNTWLSAESASRRWRVDPKICPFVAHSLSTRILLLSCLQSLNFFGRFSLWFSDTAEGHVGSIRVASALTTRLSERGIIKVLEWRLELTGYLLSSLIEDIGAAVNEFPKVYWC